MTRIYVKYSSLTEIGNECKKIASNIDKIGNDFNRNIKKLDWDVRSKDNIEAKAERLVHKLNEYEKLLKEYHKVINFAYDKYKKLDNMGDNYNLVDKLKAIDGNIFVVSNPVVDVAWTGLKSIDENISDVKRLSNIFEFSSAVFGVWDINDVVENSFEFYSDACDTWSMVNNNDVGVLSKVGAVINLGADFVDAVGNSIVEILDELGPTGIVWQTKVAGISAVIEGGLNLIGTGFMSVDENLKDGKFTFKDFVEVGIDSVNSCIFSTVESFTEDIFMEEVSDFSRGLIDDDIDLKATADIFSDNIKELVLGIDKSDEEFINDMAQNAGNNILKDSSLLSEYKNASETGKVAMTLYATTI